MLYCQRGMYIYMRLDRSSLSLQYCQTGITGIEVSQFLITVVLSNRYHRLNRSVLSNRYHRLNRSVLSNRYHMLVIAGQSNSPPPPPTPMNRHRQQIYTQNQLNHINHHTSFFIKCWFQSNKNTTVSRKR